MSSIDDDQSSPSEAEEDNDVILDDDEDSTSIGDTVQNYFKRLASDDYAPLSRELERQFGKKAQNGDVEARKQLINHNLRWATSLALKRQNQGVELGDLISEAAIGLILAVNKYNPQKARVTSYSTQRIKNELDRSIIRSPDLHFSDAAYKNFKRCLKAEKILTEGQGSSKISLSHAEIADVANQLYILPKMKKEGYESPTDDEIEERLALALKNKNERSCVINAQDVEVYYATAINSNMLSVDAPLSDDEGQETSFISQFADPKEVTHNALSEFYNSQVLQDFFLNKLSERERKVIDLFYGLGIHDPSKREYEMKGPEVAEILGEDLKSIKTVKLSTLKKIKEFIAENNLQKDDFILDAEEITNSALMID